jgi:hypothetical protein
VSSAITDARCVGAESAELKRSALEECTSFQECVERVALLKSSAADSDPEASCATVLLEMAVSFATRRTLQWVAFGGRL